MLFYNVKNFIFAASLCSKLTAHLVAGQADISTDGMDYETPDAKLPQWVAIPDNAMKDFKLQNHLRDCFIAPGQIVMDEEFSIGNDILSLNDAALTPIDDIFMPGAEFYLDGVKQDSLPAIAVYKSNEDPNVLITKNDMGVLERASKIDPVTGEAIALIPMERESQVFVEVVCQGEGAISLH